jgi:CRP/FNR family transcriptional regulator, cyclic AMP receptor protein
MDSWDSIGHVKELAQGQHIWYQGDLAGVGAFLVAGVLGVEKVNDRGDRVVFTELQPGSVLGEMSCLDGKPHSATVKALVASTIRLFTAREFDAFLTEDPNRFRHLLRRQNERLRSLTDKFVRVGTEPVQRRLAYWLCEQQADTISVTHQDLAAQLATTRESVSKALGHLRRQKCIDSRRGRITIRNKNALAEMLQSN